MGSLADEFPRVVHYQAALGALIQQYKGLPSFGALLQATTQSAQELETVLQSILVDRALGNATSAQLDVLGKIVGVARDGLSDTDLTTRIRCQIRVNLSSGTVEDIFSVIAPLFVGASGAVAKMREDQPAAFILTVLQATTPQEATLIGALVKAARSAGVYGQVVFSEVPAGQTFTLDKGPGLDVGHLAGFIS